MFMKKQLKLVAGFLTTALVLSSCGGLTEQTEAQSQSAPARTQAATSIAWGTNGDIPLTADLDGDKIADYMAFRPDNDGAGTSQWYPLYSTQNFQYIGGGDLTVARKGDVPLLGDFDGDGKADYTAWRPSTGNWTVRLSSTLTKTTRNWGTKGDIPLVADLDGDSKADFMIFRPDNDGRGTSQWYPLYSTQNYQYIGGGDLTIARKGDVPLLGDFDGDGKADYTAWRPSTGDWTVRSSITLTKSTRNWGTGRLNDIPLTADLDGDKKADFMIFRPDNDGAGTAQWYPLYSKQNYNYIGGGTNFARKGDTPLLGDFNNNGNADFVSWRPGAQGYFFTENR
jgi:protein involved in ribonucleotide reduction